VNLPQFSGPSGTGVKVAESFQLLAKKMKEIKLRISALTLTERRAWHVRMENGLHLMLGKVVNDERLNRFISAYPKLLGEKITQVDSVDLRYTNGFAVRWKESSAS